MPIKITVLGDDSRLEQLSHELSNLGYHSDYYSTSRYIGQDNLEIFDCMVFSMFPQIKSLTKALSFGKKGALLCAGLPSKDFILTANEHGFSVYDYMADPFVAMKNAIATAEGALAQAISLSPITLQSSKVLVIGFGRCGELLALKARQLGSLVHVCDCSNMAKTHAEALGFPTMHTVKNCKSYSIIFNTAPYLTLTPDLIDTMEKDVTIIDLSSSPGGTDFSYCKQKGITAKLCPSLPALYAPKTSGSILAHAIHNRLVKLQLT